MDSLFDKLKSTSNVLLEEEEPSVQMKSRIRLFSSDDDEDDDRELNYSSPTLPVTKRTTLKSNLDNDSDNDFGMKQSPDKDTKGSENDEEFQGRTEASPQKIQMNGILKHLSDDEMDGVEQNEEIIEKPIESNQPPLEVGTEDRADKMAGNCMSIRKFRIRLKRLPFPIPQNDTVSMEQTPVKGEDTCMPCTVRLKRIKLDESALENSKAKRTYRKTPAKIKETRATVNRRRNTMNEKLNALASVELPPVKRKRGRKPKIPKDEEQPVIATTSRGFTSETEARARTTAIVAKPPVSLIENETPLLPFNSRLNNNKANDIVEIDICSSNRIVRSSPERFSPQITKHNHGSSQQMKEHLFRNYHYHPYDSPSFSRYFYNAMPTARSIKKSASHKVIYERCYLTALLESNLRQNRSLISKFGKKPFMSYVKVRRPRLDEYAHISGYMTQPRCILKTPGSKKKAKQLSVSFQDHVEIFGDDSSSQDDDPSSDEDQDEVNQNSRKRTLKSEMDGNSSMPASFRARQGSTYRNHRNHLLNLKSDNNSSSSGGNSNNNNNANVTDFICSAGVLYNSKELLRKTSLDKDGHLFTSTPNVNRSKSRRKKPVLSPLKKDTDISPRQAQLKLANEKLPSKANMEALIPHTTADSDNDDGDEDNDVEGQLQETMTEAAAAEDKSLRLSPIPSDKNSLSESPSKVLSAMQEVDKENGESEAVGGELTVKEKEEETTNEYVSLEDGMPSTSEDKTATATLSIWPEEPSIKLDAAVNKAHEGEGKDDNEEEKGEEQKEKDNDQVTTSDLESNKPTESNMDSSDSFESAVDTTDINLPLLYHDEAEDGEEEQHKLSEETTKNQLNNEYESEKFEKESDEDERMVVCESDELNELKVVDEVDGEEDEVDENTPLKDDEDKEMPVENKELPMDEQNNYEGVSDEEENIQNNSNQSKTLRNLEDDLEEISNDINFSDNDLEPGEGEVGKQNVNDADNTLKNKQEEKEDFDKPNEILHYQDDDGVNLSENLAEMDVDQELPAKKNNEEIHENGPKTINEAAEENDDDEGQLEAVSMEEENLPRLRMEFDDQDSSSKSNGEDHLSDNYAELGNVKAAINTIASKDLALMVDESANDIGFLQANQDISDIVNYEGVLSSAPQNTKLLSNSLPESLEELPLKLFVDSSSDPENSTANTIAEKPVHSTLTAGLVNDKQGK